MAGELAARGRKKQDGSGRPQTSVLMNTPAFYLELATALMKVRPFGVPKPVALSQPFVTVSELSMPKPKSA